MHMYAFYSVSIDCLHVRLHMSPQIACCIGCIVTLVAFVCLFSTVHFQMCPQIACPRGCIITLVAFVLLFSAVHLQVRFQTACIRRSVITLVAFSRLFCAVCLQISLLVILCFILRIFFIDIVLSGLKILKVFFCHSYWSK